MNHPALKRWSVRALRALVLIYLGLAVVLYLLQDSLIFPGRSTQGQKQAVIRESQDGSYQLVHLTTAGGNTTTALFGAALDSDGKALNDAKTRPTVIFFYGNGMCLADCFGLHRDLRKLGVNVLAVEYVGYGMSTGKPSETTFYQSADAAWDHLQTRTDIDRSKIIAMGWSIGGAVAIDLASRKPVIALATVSAFSSMKDMANRLLPWFPASLVLRHRFDSAAKIRTIGVPIFIAHGRHDAIIPHDMSIVLKAAAQSAPRVVVVDLNSDHNDAFETGDALFGPLKEFFDSLR